MQGTYYETDRFFTTLFVVLCVLAFTTAFRWYEKKHGINDRNRAEHYSKNLNERR